MKIMHLVLDGGTETYRVGPFHSLVAVQDEASFYKATRATLRGELVDEGALQGIPMAEREEVVRSTKVILIDTGLNRWPVSGEDISDLLQRMTDDYNRKPRTR